MSTIQQQLVERLITLERQVADLRAREIPATRVKLSAFQDGEQSLPDNVYTPVIYDQVDFIYGGDPTNSYFNGIYEPNDPSHFIAPITGTYLIHASLAFNTTIAWVGGGNGYLDHSDRWE